MAFGTGYKKRERGLYEPLSREPFRISRSKIDLFVECPRCFYLDQRHGVGRPSMPAFTLNNAVDELIKKEFDIYRASGAPHPLMKRYGIDAVPLLHKDLSKWRDALRHGVEYLDPETNLSVRGGIDDVWTAPSGELFVVDYKATSKRKEIELYEHYKRQIEVYQWLFRKNGFRVSDTGYFVYVNGRTDAKAFDEKLEFNTQLISHTGNAKWIDEVLPKIKACLDSAEAPKKTDTCEHCAYREAAGHTLLKLHSLRNRVKTRKLVTKKHETETKGPTLF